MTSQKMKVVLIMKIILPKYFLLFSPIDSTTFESNPIPAIKIK